MACHVESADKKYWAICGAQFASGHRLSGSLWRIVDKSKHVGLELQAPTNDWDHSWYLTQAFMFEKVDRLGMMLHKYRY